MELQAANGKKMLALKVFAYALKFFKDHCLQELSDQSSTKIVNDDIRWVITVPAIWRQPAKQFMRQAAYEVSTSVIIAVDLVICYSITLLQTQLILFYVLYIYHAIIILIRIEYNFLSRLVLRLPSPRLNSSLPLNQKLHPSTVVS